MKFCYKITIVLMEEPWIFSELEACDGSYETDLKSWSAEILII